MKVELEKLQDHHASVSYKWRNDPEVWVHTFNRPDREITEEDELNWVRKVIAIENDARYAILVDGVYVGNIYLTGIKDGESYYGIFIGEKAHWGKGVGRMASDEILRIGKEERGLKRVFLRVKKENTGGVKLYHNLGFRVIEEHGDYFLMQIDLV